MKNLNLNYLKSMDIDYTTVVNHTFDVVEGSILCIDNVDNNKLNEYISSSLNKNPKFVITSNKCDIQDEKIELINSLIKNHSGNNNLSFQVFDNDEKIMVDLDSQKQKINISSDLLSKLDDNKILYKLN